MGLTCRDKELKDEIFQNELIISCFPYFVISLKVYSCDASQYQSTKFYTVAEFCQSSFMNLFNIQL